MSINSNNRESILNRQNKTRISISVPFRNTDGEWFTCTKTTEDTIFEDIKAYIFTNKGERVMRPDFGIGLRKYLFEPNDDVIKSSLTSEINDGLNKYFSFVNIDNIVIARYPEDATLKENQLKISIALKLKFADQIIMKTIEEVIS